MLLGINCGHLEETEAIVRIVNGSTVEHPQFRSVANIAIAQVVPAWHIFKMLEGKKFKLQRQKADGKLVREVNFIKDKKTRDFLHVPKGNVKMLKADGSVEISDATPEQKARRKIMRSISEKSKSEQ